MYSYKMSIIDLCNKYGAIDTSFGTDKNTVHSYGTTYDRILTPFKDTAQNVLEIGFDSGASLQVYSEYFTNANIYGIDIRDNCKPEYKLNPKVQMVFGDAKDASIVNHYKTNFDVIIEDASHLPRDQIQHFIDFSDKVADGGIYIIEDVDGHHLSFLRDTLQTISDMKGFTMEVIDLRNIKGRFDDIIFVFRRNTA
jgi:hypothetical protein